MGRDLQNRCHAVHGAEFVENLLVPGPPHLSCDVMGCFSAGRDKIEDFPQPLLMMGK